MRLSRQTYLATVSVLSLQVDVTFFYFFVFVFQNVNFIPEIDKPKYIMRFLCAIVLLEYYIHFTGHVVTSVLFVYIELGNFRMTLAGTDIDARFSALYFSQLRRAQTILIQISFGITFTYSLILYMHCKAIAIMSLNDSYHPLLA